jgi:glutamine cyclotransferase
LDAQNSPLYPTAQHAQEIPSGASVPVYSYRIVNTYPHDREAFTQGLVIANGELYEGTGRHGASTLRRVDLASGQVQKLRVLPEQYFGEGIALVGDRVFQLTWKANVGFIYDRETFELLDSFQYSSEGWGLTYDGQHLIMSDGTPTLYFLDPETQQETGQVQVTYLGQPVRGLNELEYVQGEVWANVWKTNMVVRIDPRTGQITGVIDLSGLLSADDLSQPVDVLNGIAYDVENESLFVTGKLWPKLFEIELVSRE